MSINEVSWIHELAQRHLAHQDVRVHPPLDVVMCGLASAGLGLDHSVGEEVLAFADHSAQGKLQQYFAVTDRRLIAVDGAERWALPYRDIQHVELASPGELVIHAYGARYVHRSHVAGALGSMLQALTQMAPQHREPPVRPLFKATSADPTGAWTAASWMDQRETRLALLLRFIYGAQKRHAMYGAVGADLVARITLGYRNDRGGRGMASGHWMSPLTAGDLADTFSHLYGQPLVITDQPVHTREYAVPRPGIHPGESISSAAGVLSAVVVGVGWQERRPFVPVRFKVQLSDTGSFSSFALLDERGAALSSTSPALLMAIHKALLGMEREVILRRVVLGAAPFLGGPLRGADVSYAQLLAAPAGYIDAQLGTRLGRSA